MPLTPRRVHWGALGALLAGSAGGALGAGCVAGTQPGLSGAPATDAEPASVGVAAPPPLAGRHGFDEPLSGTVGDAYVRYEPQARSWIVGNARFEQRLELQPTTGGLRLARRYLVAHDRGIRLDVAETEPGDGGDTGERGEDDAPIHDALGIAIEDQSPLLAPLDQTIEVTPDGALQAALRFRDWRTGADLIAELRLRPGHAVVEHRASIHCRGERAWRLTRLDAADLVVDSSAEARWRVATLDNQGDVAFARLGPDGVREAETPAQSAARAPVIPLLVLHDAAGDEGLFLALRWTTNYLLKARALGASRVALEAGVRMLADPGLDPRAAVAAPPGFEVRPGETVSSPWLVLGIFDGTLDDAANALKRYLSDERPRAPSWAADTMPVTWNSWFGYDRNVDYPAMAREARLARQLGIEVFYVDHGWEAALGDWRPHPRRFPGRALRRLADDVHRAGMRFGLWVAFGVAAPHSLLLRRHPEYRARQPSPAGTGIDESLPLCLFRAREWVQQELARLVGEYALDWLKFDQPMVAACRDVSHGHDVSVRGSLHANTQAFYDILAWLRREAPHLFIESTFDGAGYLDYGVFARCHAAWLDDAAGDASVPMTVPQQSLYGASLAFPARYLTLWLARPPADADLEPAEGRGLSPQELAYQAYSTMGGNWGVSLKLSELAPAQQRAIRDLVADYATLREVLPGADVYHLAPPLTGDRRRAAQPSVDDWLALQYHQPELGRGAILAVRNGGGPDWLPVRPRGLLPQVPYQVVWSDGRVLARERGETLMRRGVSIQRRPYSGGLIWVTPTG